MPSGTHELAADAAARTQWRRLARPSARAPAAGLVYGLRAHGPWQPEHGHRFNADKLLLDPYAREIVGRFDWQREHYGGECAQVPTRDNALMR